VSRPQKKPFPDPVSREIISRFPDLRSREMDSWGRGESAPVERVFSGCALVTTRNRNRLSADSISLTLFLNKAWVKVREMGLQGAVAELYSDEEEEVVDE
jgi:hypothetical protein